MYFLYFLLIFYQNHSFTFFCIKTQDIFFKFITKCFESFYVFKKKLYHEIQSAYKQKTLKLV